MTSLITVHLRAITEHPPPEHPPKASPVNHPPDTARTLLGTGVPTTLPTTLHGVPFRFSALRVCDMLSNRAFMQSPRAAGPGPRRLVVKRAHWQRRQTKLSAIGRPSRGGQSTGTHDDAIGVYTRSARGMVDQRRT